MPEPGDILRATPVFSGLEDAAFQRLLSLGRLRRYAKGDVLFVEMEKGDEFMVILDGCVTVEIALRNADDRFAVATIGVGDILGEVNLVEEGIRSATATAEADTEVMVWDCSALRAECEKDPKLGFQLIQAVARILAQRLRLWNVRLLDSALWGMV